MKKIDINEIIKELKQYSKENKVDVEVKIENGIGQYYEKFRK